MDRGSTTPDPPDSEADDDLDATVARLLGRRPQGDYSVSVSRPDGTPVVLLNAPFLHSGRPMPTRYWLVDPELNKAIGRIESIGGVKAAEAAIAPEHVAAAHDRYRRERERLIPVDHTGPRPTGGVGGTRQGVKCLHAHYAYHLAGGDDPVGRWVHDRLSESGDVIDGLVTVDHRPDDVGRGSGAGDRVAVVEIGSGAVKALIRTPSGLERLRLTTDLIAEPSVDGSLGEDARHALEDALRRVADVAEANGGIVSRVIATEAARSRHRSEVAALVASHLGVTVDVVDGEEEAVLGHRAVSAAASPGADEALVTIDIGHGSTELAAGPINGDVSSFSMPVGATTITTDHLSADPPDPAELSSALSVVGLHLDDIERERPELVAAIAESPIVGLGAIRFVAEVELGVADGDGIEGYRLERGAAEELFRALATEAHADRAANPGLQPDHVGWIVGAMCILLGFMRRFDVDGIQVSTLGLLDGVLASIESPPPSNGNSLR